MGVFATIQLEDGVDLPEFEGDKQKVWWQSKRGIDRYDGPYKITTGGRLMRRDKSMRDKTEEEKLEEAEEYDFESWESYKEAVLDADMGEAMENDYPIGTPRSQVVDEKWWADHNKHGSFEFHGSSEDDTWYSYEARFTKGNLDKIVLLNKEER